MSDPTPRGTLVAGVDVGNSTTEIVVASVGPGGSLQPLADRRRPTAGLKGSKESLEGAARMLCQLENDVGMRAAVVGLADLAPAPVVDATWPSRAPDYGVPIRLVQILDGATSAGFGLFVGRYVDLHRLSRSDAGRLVVGVDADWDFEDAARTLRDAMGRGTRVVGVLVERDEAVLIGNRLGTQLPIVDTVRLRTIEPGSMVAGEVARSGGALRRLPDPVFLAHALELPPELVSRLRPLSAYLARRSVAIVHRVVGTRACSEVDPVIGHVSWERDDEAGEMVLPAHGDELARLLPVGAVTRVGAVPNTALAAALASCPAGVRDLVALDVEGAHQVPVGLLAASAEVDIAAPELEAFLGRPVVSVGSEADAARRGALTTPGLPTDVIVVDVGAGTLDVVSPNGHVVVAGAGNLITSGLAAALDLPTGLAERAKVLPSVRVETPHIAAREDGVRVFLDAPAPGAHIGRLALMDDTGGLVGLGTRMAPEEWQRRRLEIKATILQRGLARATRALGHDIDDRWLVLLAGGGAQDIELVNAAVGRARLGQVATADVDGRFGPRYAVAWGLALALVQSSGQGEGV